MERNQPLDSAAALVAIIVLGRNYDEKLQQDLRRDDEARR
jgi:hypothetical protein